MAKRYKYPKNRLLSIFRGMHNRCINPSCPRYHGRGISVDLVWTKFEAFEVWANTSGYSPYLTLDRENNDLGYSPTNCRWATFVTQARNRGKRAGGVSQYMGVAWYTRNNKWAASVFYDRKNHHLGLYLSEEDAARARDNHIVSNNLVGFNLNFP